MSGLPTRYFRRTRLLRLVVLPLTLVAFLSGCFKWVEVEPPYTDARMYVQPRIRVQLTDRPGYQFIDNARVERDSLVGTQWAVPTERIALPLEQVQRLEIEEKDELKSAVGGIIVLGGLALLVSQSDFCIKVLLEDCRD